MRDVFQEELGINPALFYKQEKLSLLEEILRIKPSNSEFAEDGRPIIIVPTSTNHPGNLCLYNAKDFLQNGRFIYHLDLLIFNLGMLSLLSLKLPPRTRCPKLTLKEKLKTRRLCLKLGIMLSISLDYTGKS